jgi:hypothetical protein
VALAGLESEQTEHNQVPLWGLGGGAKPAADQSKPFAGPVGGAGGVDEVGVTGAGEGEDESVGAGRGESQTAHFSFASAGFCNSQTEHFHVCGTVTGAFRPAAVQLNPFMARTGAMTTANS